MDQETFDVIEKISNEHCKKTFGYFDQNDLRNEIWVICLEKLNQFRPVRGKLEHFLRVAVKNRLINKFKDITKSVRSPCPRCPFYQPGSLGDCEKFGLDKIKCTKWKNYCASVESRNSLLVIKEPSYDRSFDDNGIDQTMTDEVRGLLLDQIDPSYKDDFVRMMSGIRISKQKARRIKTEVSFILKKAGYVQKEQEREKVRNVRTIKGRANCVHKRKRRKTS